MINNIREFTFQTREIATFSYTLEGDDCQDQTSVAASQVEGYTVPFSHGRESPRLRSN
jgi:hypothetical protein